MRIGILLFAPCLFLLLSTSVYAQVFDGNAEWTWMSGSIDNLDRGDPNALPGVPTATTRPPSRWQSVAWTGNDGNLWLFGGEYNNGNNGGIYGNTMNDLWMYNITTGQWTWVKGTFSATSNAGFGDQGVYGPLNTPGANYLPRSRRGAAGWKDANGVFWVFGGWNKNGSTLATGYLNDLWNYNTTTGMWTWVSGTNGYVTHGNYGTRGVAAASNIPGGRGGGNYHGGNPVSWVDANGDFWVFGGLGYGGAGVVGALNDLWKYTPSTGMWTWISGSNAVNQQGVYGTRGVAAAANMPGGRFSAYAWQGSNGLFYLFGGEGRDAGGNAYFLNDLWTYDPATNMWTWINGSNLPDQYASYGTMGVAAAANQPGARMSMGQPRGWHDAFGKFWLYAGRGYGHSTAVAPTYQSDLWQYDPATNIWTWMKGPDPATNTHLPVPGVRGVRAPANRPGSKHAFATWTDLSGNFWLLGGLTRANQGIYQDRPTNDLWRLDQVAVPPAAPIYTNALPHVCAGDTMVSYTVNTIPNATSYEWIYTGTGVTLRGGASTTVPANGLDFAANATSGQLRVRAVNQYGNSAYTDTFITVNPVPVVSLGDDIDTCGIMSLTLNAPSGYPNATYLWSNGATTPSVTVADSARYWVTVDVNGCSGSDTIRVRIIPVMVDLGPDTAICDYNLPLTLTSAQHPDIHFLWSNGLSTREMDVTKTGNYWLEVSYSTCKDSDTIRVEVVKSPDVFAGHDTTICSQFPLTIGTEIPGYDPAWNTGATTHYIEVQETGTYILEVSQKGCIAADTVNITALPVPPLSLGADKDICENQTLTLNASLPDGVSYEWNTGAETPSIETDEAGLYYVTVVTSYRCVGRDSIFLTLYPDPQVTLPEDTVVCEENPLEIVPNTFNTESLRWSDGSAGNTLTVSTGGVYAVTAINKCSTASDTVNVAPIYCDLWAPNAFSPNGDGKNDVFRIRGNLGKIEKFGLSVYNRWGERIYHSMDKSQGWDGMFRGSPALIGTYSYLLEYEIAGKPYQMKGDFHLVR